MKRLQACKGEDPYSILGVRADSSDDDIKKYYIKSWRGNEIYCLEGKNYKITFPQKPWIPEAKIIISINQKYPKNANCILSENVFLEMFTTKIVTSIAELVKYNSTQSQTFSTCPGWVDIGQPLMPCPEYKYLMKCNKIYY